MIEVKAAAPTPKWAKARHDSAYLPARTTTAIESRPTAIRNSSQLNTDVLSNRQYGRHVYENPAGQTGRCEESVEWRGRHRFTVGWKPVWSCERHAGGMVGARSVGLNLPITPVS
jgi:hypothetical protein